MIGRAINKAIQEVDEDAHYGLRHRDGASYPQHAPIGQVKQHDGEKRTTRRDDQRVGDKRFDQPAIRGMGNEAGQ
jgi:hypothetical protein